MSINVILHCRDGIVLGCDSLGSMIQPLLEPETGRPILDKTTGQPLLHPDTKEPIIDVNTLKKRNVVINTIGYENKLFPIKDYPVGIITSGLGMIGDRCIEDLVGEFSFGLPPYAEVEKEFSLGRLVENINSHIGQCYAESFKSLPSLQSGPQLNLLIGGYSSGKYLGEIYGLNFPSTKIIRYNSDKKPYTMNTSGQPDAIERFLKGMENETLNQIMRGIVSNLQQSLIQMEKHTRGHIVSELKKKGILFDEQDIAKTPPLEITGEFPLKLATYQIPFGLFSIQNAVDFVVFLIYITYGKQRFVAAIPTVGGDIRIAYITRREGFIDLTPKKIDVSIFKI